MVYLWSKDMQSKNANFVEEKFSSGSRKAMWMELHRVVTITINCNLSSTEHISFGGKFKKCETKTKYRLLL